MDKIKLTIRIPTRSYAYYEIEAEVDNVSDAAFLYFEAEKEFRRLEKKEKEKPCCGKYPRCSCPQPIK